MGVEIGNLPPVRKARPGQDGSQPGNALSGVQEAQGISRPGRRPDSFYRLAVASAILHLGDRAALEFKPSVSWLALGDLLTSAIPARSGERDFA